MDQKPSIVLVAAFPLAVDLSPERRAERVRIWELSGSRIRREGRRREGQR
jgi:hypothetical protein